MLLARFTQALRTRVTSSLMSSPRVLMTSGCMLSSSVAFFQSIFGWKAASHGYPRIISSSPMFETRNFMSLTSVPHRTCRSTNSFMVPDRLCVPSMFQMVRGCVNWSVPIFILLRSLVLIKLSVAPESTSTCLSALECFDCKRVGIFKLRYLQANTLLSPKVRAQAVGVAPLKNPCRHLLLLAPP